MRIVRHSFAMLLAVLLVAPAAQAQTHVIGKSALSEAVQQRVSQEQADREAILSLLHRPEVQQIAAQAGLSLEKAEAAVSTLNGQDLRDPRAGAAGCRTIWPAARRPWSFRRRPSSSSCSSSS